MKIIILIFFLSLIQIVSTQDSFSIPEFYISKIVMPSNNVSPTFQPTFSPSSTITSTSNIFSITNTKERYTPIENSLQDITSIVYNNFTDLPFNFRMFGQTLSSIYVHPNGAISPSARLGCSSVPLDNSICSDSSLIDSNSSCDCTEGTLAPLISQASLLECLTLRVYSFSSKYNDELYAFTLVFSGLCMKELRFNNVKVTFFKDNHIEILYSYIGKLESLEAPITGLFPPAILTNVTYYSSNYSKKYPNLYYIFDESQLKQNQNSWEMTKSRGYFPLYSSLKTSNSFLLCPASPIFSVQSMTYESFNTELKIDFYTTHLSCFDSIVFVFYYSNEDNLTSTLKLLSNCSPRRETDSVILGCKADATIQSFVNSNSTSRVYFWPAYSISTGNTMQYKILSEKSIFIDFSTPNLCSTNYNISSSCPSSECLLISGELDECFEETCNYSQSKYTTSRENQLYSPPDCSKNCVVSNSTSGSLPYYARECCRNSLTDCNGTCSNLSKSGFYISKTFAPTFAPSIPPTISPSFAPTITYSPTTSPSIFSNLPTEFPTISPESILTINPTTSFSPTIIPIKPISSINYEISSELTCCASDLVDCTGVCNGDVTYDACNICGGTNEVAVFDCEGVCGGSAKLDACNVCKGNDTIGYSCFEKDSIKFWIHEMHDSDFQGGSTPVYVTDTEILNSPTFAFNKSLTNLYPDVNVTLVIYNTSPYHIIVQVSSWNNDYSYITSGPDVLLEEAFLIDSSISLDDDQEYYVDVPTHVPTSFPTNENMTEFVNPIYNNTLNSTGFYQNQFKVKVSEKIALRFTISIDNLLKGYYKKWLFKRVKLSYFPINLPKAIYSLDLVLKPKVENGCKYFKIDQCTRVPGCFYCFSMKKDSLSLIKSNKNNRKKKFFLIKSSYSKYNYVESQNLVTSNPYSPEYSVGEEVVLLNSIEKIEQNNIEEIYDESIINYGRKLFSSYIPLSLEFFSSQIFYELDRGSCVNGFDESVCVYEAKGISSGTSRPPILENTDDNISVSQLSSSGGEVHLVAIILPLIIIWIVIMSYFIYYWKNKT